MQPEVLRRKDNIQLSFNLPHRIYEARVYPRRSSNGSTIFVCAHEQGLRVVWYGGKKFKEATTNHKPVNGDSIDLTDKQEDDVQKFEEDDLFDESVFPEVLTYLDVPLGTACTRLAIPPVPTEPTSDGYPSLLDSHIVAALAGADQSLKLVSLPLQPRESRQQAGIQVINIVGTNSHQDLISDVAVTLTAEVADGEESTGQATRNWSFLLASASPTGHGVLLTHQIPIDTSGRLSMDAEDHVPIQRQYLRTSLTSCHLNFNASLYPAERHSHLLLTMTDGSLVKVFNLLSQSKHSKPRRGSAATNDSSLSAARSVRQNSSINGRLLITLLPPFAPLGPHDLSSERKRVLDAAWVLQGRGIIVLMEDGEWGIWDIEAAGPATPGTSNNLVRGQGNVSGIQGGSVTRFAITGNVNPGNQVSKSSSTKKLASTDATLAPMTPHTRKVRSQGLFKGPEQADKLLSNTASVFKGKVSVTAQTGIASNTARARDETVLFSYGSHRVLLPSIHAYWQTNLNSRSAFGGSNSSRPSVLPPVIVAGEDVDTVDLLPIELLEGETSPINATTTPGFLAATASRIMISLPPRSPNRTRSSVVSSLPMRLNAARSDNAEQTLLQSGELDIGGMDRILDSMAGAPAERNLVPAGFARKSVNFQFNDDDDGDIDMGTPTHPKSAKSKLIVTRNIGEPRRIFS